jgi:hypothetical protein
MDLEELVTVLGSVPVVTVRSGQVDLSTADGKTVARILGSVAQGEVEKRGERVARAARQRAEAGRFGGGTRRFGYNATMTELVPEEAAAIESGVAALLAGGSVRGVWKDWVARGLTGPTGAALTTNAVRTTLLRPANAGLSIYRGEVVGSSSAPAIIDEATFLQLRALLTDPRRRTSPEGDHRTLLSGVLRCGVCGGPVRAHTRKRSAQAPSRPSYACVHRHVTRSREKLDAAVSDLVVAYLVKHRVALRRAPQAASKAAQRAAAEADVLRGKLEQLAALMAGGDLDPADYAAAARGLRARLADADARVSRHAGTPRTAKLLEADDVAAAWSAATPSVRRSIVRELIESITLPVGAPGRFSVEGVTVAWRSGSPDL